MANEYKLSVVAPDRTVFEGNVVAVIVPGANGYLGALAGHEDSIVALKTGIVEYTDSKGERYYVSIGGGFLELSKEGAIILADTAERSTEIDIERAEKALDEARKALRGEVSGVTTQQATAVLERAVNRVRAAQHH